MTSPEWVEPGAQAAKVAYAEVEGDDIWTILSAAVIAAVEPLIRAQIAADIEAATPAPMEGTDYLNTYISGMTDAARIARGES